MFNGLMRIIQNLDNRKHKVTACTNSWIYHMTMKRQGEKSE